MGGKRIIKVAIVSFFVLFLGIQQAQAGSFVFYPHPIALEGLDHWYYYAWVINWTPPETIIEAKLIFKNIYDWTVEDGDHLYSHLLNTPNTSGGTQIGANSYSSSWKWYDAQVGGNNWSGVAPQIGDWSDPSGGSPSNFDLVYNLKDLGLLDELNTYAQDGTFGFGFDPDCHYWNSGVSLELETIPEPASLSLLGLGLLGLMGLKRRKIM